MIVKQDTGRELQLDALYQDRTYGGLIVGNPTPVWNDRLIKAAMMRAATRNNSDRPAFVIPPVRTRLVHLPARTPRPSDQDPSTHYERLGFITCVGHFNSKPVGRSDSDRSCLTVVWWQDEFAFPLESGVEASLKGLDWDVHAWEWSF